jgi:hypothetical protein
MKNSIRLPKNFDKLIYDQHKQNLSLPVHVKIIFDSVVFLNQVKWIESFRAKSKPITLINIAERTKIYLQ